MSPFSYLAFKALEQENFWQEHGVTFRFRPVPMAKVIKRYPTMGPAEIPPKRLYLFKSCLRNAHRLGIPFGVPPKLPFNSLQALRLALPIVSGEYQLRVISTFFDQAWAHEKDLENPDFLFQVIQDLGLDADTIFTASDEKEARKAIKINIKDAVGFDLFGVPSFVVFKNEKSAETFWGQDSIIDLKNYIEGRDSIEPQLIHKFQTKFTGNQGAQV